MFSCWQPIINGQPIINTLNVRKKHLQQKSFVPWTRAASHTHIQHILLYVRGQVLLGFEPPPRLFGGRAIILAGTSSLPVFCILYSHCPSHTGLRSSSSPAGHFDLKSHRDTRHTTTSDTYLWMLLNGGPGVSSGSLQRLPAARGGFHFNPVFKATCNENMCTTQGRAREARVNLVWVLCRLAALLRKVT